MRGLKKYQILLIIILLLAFSMRLYAAYATPLNTDEKVYIETAKKISFDPDNLNLPIGDHHLTMNHPILSSYVIKFSGMLFGDTKLGFRILYVLIGTISIYLVYLLTRKIYSIKVALVAAAFYAFNRYLLFRSKVVTVEPLQFFFILLAVYSFYNIYKTQRSRWYLYLGLFMGLGFLSRESTVMLVPFFIFFYLKKDLKNRRMKIKLSYLALSLIVFFLLIAPDLYWNSKTEYSNYSYSLNHINSFHLGPRAAYFYVSTIIPGNFEDSNVPMDPLTGIILLAGTAGGLIFVFRKKLEKQYWFFPLMFLAIFGLFSLFHRARPRGSISFWVAAASIIPAIIVSSDFFVRLSKKYRVIKWLILGFIIYQIIISSLVFFNITEDYTHFWYFHSESGAGV